MADKNMNAKISVDFEESASRQSLNSGDSLPTLFGKTKKFFSDLKPVALSGSYNDLTDTPDSTSVLNTVNGNPITVTDGADAPLIELGVYGKSVQDTSSEGVASGKNLLPINASSQTINGITFTVNSDKSITVKGTATNSFYYCVWGKGEYGGVPLEKGTYIVSFGKETFISVSFKKGNQIVGGGGKKADYYEFDFEPSEDTYNTIRVAVQYTLGVTYNETLYPMIRNANIVDDSYEPYIGTPTPDAPIDIVSVGDDGNVEITACGKNLIEGSQDFSGTWIYPWATSEETYQNLVVKEHTGAWNGTAKKVYIKEGKTYTFSAYVKQSGNDTITIYTIPSQSMNIANGADVSKHSLPISVTTEWQRFTHTFTCIKSGYATPRFESSTSSTTVYICGFQLEESDLMTEYEPYKGNAVTITSGLPFCAVGDVRDEFVYNADGTGKIIKRTAKIVLDGSNDEAWQYSEGNAPFQITISDGSLWESRTELPKLYCNKYQRVPQGATWGSYDYMVSTNTNGTLLAIRDISVTTLEAFKEKLNAVPMTVVYVLATPKEIKLSAVEMAELMKLQTFDGMTTIYNDEGAEMTVKYWCDSNINALLNNKANQNDLISHIKNKSNPHEVTKSQIGLENVENKSSATIRSEITSDNVIDALGYAPMEDITVPITKGGTGATTAKAAEYYITAGMTEETDELSDVTQVPFVYAGASATKGRFYWRKVTYLWNYIKDKISSVLGLTATQYNGNAKTATTATNATKVNNHTVESDVPSDAVFTDTTYSAATTSANGLMTSAMVTKLNGIATGATKVTVDSAMSTTSTNPVQNKVIKAAIDELASSGGIRVATGSFSSYSGTINCGFAPKLVVCVSKGGTAYSDIAMINGVFDGNSISLRNNGFSYNFTSIYASGNYVAIG